MWLQVGVGVAAAVVGSEESLGRVWVGVVVVVGAGCLVWVCCGLAVAAAAVGSVKVLVGCGLLL